MTAVTIQSNKIVSNEVKATKCYYSHFRGKKNPNEHFGQSNILMLIMSRLHVLSGCFRKELRGGYFRVDICICQLCFPFHLHIAVAHQKPGLYIIHVTS